MGEVNGLRDESPRILQKLKHIC